MRMADFEPFVNACRHRGVVVEEEERGLSEDSYAHFIVGPMTLKVRWSGYLKKNSSAR